MQIIYIQLKCMHNIEIYQATFSFPSHSNTHKHVTHTRALGNNKTECPNMHIMEMIVCPFSKINGIFPMFQFHIQTYLESFRPNGSFPAIKIVFMCVGGCAGAGRYFRVSDHSSLMMDSKAFDSHLENYSVVKCVYRKPLAIRSISTRCMALGWCALVSE